MFSQYSSLYQYSLGTLIFVRSGNWIPKESIKDCWVFLVSKIGSAWIKGMTVEFVDEKSKIRSSSTLLDWLSIYRYIYNFHPLVRKGGRGRPPRGRRWPWCRRCQQAVARVLILEVTWFSFRIYDKISNFVWILKMRGVQMEFPWFGGSFSHVLTITFIASSKSSPWPSLKSWSP